MAPAPDAGWRALAARFGRFSLVGLALTLLNYVLLLVLLRLGVHHVSALLICWSLSVGLGFVLNRRLTFRVAGPDLADRVARRQLGRYAASSLFQLAFAMAGFVALIDGLSIPPAIAYPINLVVVSLANFAILDRLVFPARVSPLPEVNSPSRPGHHVGGS